jgi:hypothetical protein
MLIADLGRQVAWGGAREVSTGTFSLTEAEAAAKTMGAGATQVGVSGSVEVRQVTI